MLAMLADRQFHLVSATCSQLCKHNFRIGSLATLEWYPFPGTVNGCSDNHEWVNYVDGIGNCPSYYTY